MTSTNPVETAAVPTDLGRDMRSGGVVLFIGALLFITTIGFELRVGWPPPDAARGADIAALIRQLWPSLRWIWAVQMLAGFLFGLSAFLILRSRHLEHRWIANTVIWSACAIGGTIVTVAFGLTLGGYPPALVAVEENPEIFATFRGGIRTLYGIGLGVVGLGHLVLFIGEGIAKGGVVPRYWLVGTILAIGLGIMAGAAGLVPLPAVGVVVFLIPALLGLALWRAGRDVRPGETPEPMTELDL